jgi:hypothetical protein
MEKDFIIKINHTIAKFLGWFQQDSQSPEHYTWWERNDCANYVAYCIPDNYPHNDLPFHRDWNYLMKVVDKIESLRDKFNNFYSVQIGMAGANNPHQCTIEAPLWKTQINNADTKIEAVWLAVYNFIEWYNQNKE